VSPHRKHLSEDENHSGRPNLALSAEMLRNAQECGREAAAPPKGEEKISVFWRVFGGTLLSIAALVCMTIYQQFSASLNDLRASISHLNEFHAEVVKKDELNNRTTAIWASLKDLGNDVPVLKTHTAVLERQLRAVEQERKELVAQVQLLRERLAALEGHHTGLSAAKTPSLDRNDTAH
jgi:septal ring factor EnvC (AmiA/AmiB activator)